MRLCLLPLLLLPYFLFSNIGYKTGNISLNGFSGLNFTSQITSDSLSFYSLSTSQKKIDEDNFSIYLNTTNSNLYINRREDNLALSVAYKKELLKDLNLLLSSTYSQGEITPGIYHSIGLKYTGIVESNFYYSKYFTEVYRTGDRYIFSLGYTKGSLGMEFIIHKSDKFISGKQKRLDNTTDLILNTIFSSDLFEVKNSGSISNIENYFKKEDSITVKLKLEYGIPYIGYKYEDLDKNGSLNIKNSFLAGINIMILNNLELKVDSTISYINHPFYQLSTTLLYTAGGVKISPYLKYERIEDENVTPGIKLNIKGKSIKSSLDFSYLNLDKESWELSLNISSFIE